MIKKTLFYLSCLFFFLSVYLFIAAVWARLYFGVIEWEQVILNLTQPLEGVAVQLMFGGFVVVFFIGSVFGFVLLSLIKRFFPKCVSLLLLTGAILLLSYPCSIWHLVDFIRAQTTTSRLYEENYTVPTIQASHRNLILIILESYEKSFQNTEVFGENLSPKLTHIQNENTSFNGFYQLKQTGWTITGLMAALCGVPLKLNNHFINLSSFKEFMPNLMCWPEQLARQGYQNVLMKAAAIQFTGTNHFARRHGFQKAVGYKELKDKYDDNHESEWGLNDRAFYRAVQDELTNLAQTNQPFFLTTIQADTHQPRGHLNPTCREKYHDYRDAVICSDSATADFIDWIKQQPFYQNTTVVVTGDHLVAATNIDSLLKKLPRRDIYLTVINPANNKKPLAHQFTTLDIAPTILDALGVHFNGTYGLGRSLYRTEKTLYEKIPDFEFLLSCRSEKYASFGNEVSVDIFDVPKNLTAVYSGETIHFSTDVFEKVAVKGLNEFVLNQYWSDADEVDLKIKLGFSAPFLLRFSLKVPLFGISEEKITVFIDNKKQADWIFNAEQTPDTVLEITPNLVKENILTVKFKIQGKKQYEKAYSGVLFESMSLQALP